MVSQAIYTNKGGGPNGQLQFITYEMEMPVPCSFYTKFLTNLPIRSNNAAALIESGRRRWKIENGGFNVQKKHRYFLEHLFSKNYQALKNHYYLIQIGHMISPVMEAWEKLWKKSALDLSEKHRRIWESFRNIKLSEYMHETEKGSR